MYYFVVSIAIIVLGFLCVVECIRSGKRRKEEELKSWISRAIKTYLVLSRSHRVEVDTYKFVEEFLIMQGVVSENDFSATHIGKLEAMIFAEIYNQAR